MSVYTFRNQDQLKPLDLSGVDYLKEPFHIRIFWLTCLHRTRGTLYFFIFAQKNKILSAPMRTNRTTGKLATSWVSSPLCHIRFVIHPKHWFLNSQSGFSCTPSWRRHHSPSQPWSGHWGRASFCPPRHTRRGRARRSAPGHRPSPRNSAAEAGRDRNETANQNQWEFRQWGRYQPITTSEFNYWPKAIKCSEGLTGWALRLTQKWRGNTWRASAAGGELWYSTFFWELTGSWLHCSHFSQGRRHFPSLPVTSALSPGRTLTGPDTLWPGERDSDWSF